MRFVSLFGVFAFVDFVGYCLYVFCLFWEAGVFVGSLINLSGGSNMCRIACVGGRGFRSLGFNLPEPKVVVPGMYVPVIDRDGIYLAKWGVPLRDTFDELVYNARAEKVYCSLLEGTGFWRGSRLVYVPLTGIKEGGRWFALYEDREPDPVFALAVQTGFKEKGRVALVTTDALPPISQYHHRQPFVVSVPEFYDKVSDYFGQNQVPLSVVSGW